MGQLRSLTAGAAQRSRAGSRASEFTYLESDAGKTQRAKGRQHRGSRGISFYLCVAVLHGLSNMEALREPDILQISSELPRCMFQERVTQVGAVLLFMI